MEARLEERMEARMEARLAARMEARVEAAVEARVEAALAARQAGPAVSAEGEGEAVSVADFQQLQAQQAELGALLQQVRPCREGAAERRFDLPSCLSPLPPPPRTLAFPRHSPAHARLSVPRVLPGASLTTL
jgi:hypothetical protein